MDEDLRSRFRRDFNSQPAHRPQPSSRPAEPPKVVFNRPASSQPSSQPQPGLNRNPAGLQSQNGPSSQQHQSRPQPQVSFEAPGRQQPRKNRRKFWLAFIILLIVLAAGGGVYWYRFARPVIPIPSSVRQSVNYPLLYPSKLPPGYQINQSSFTTTKGAVIFEADDKGSNKIVFSLQKRPATFDFASFYKQGMGGAAPFTTPAGEAAIGTANGQPLGSFATDQAWMLITAPAGHISSADLRLILNDIKIAS